MNLYGVILAAYRAFCKDSSHFTKHEAQRLLTEAVNASPCNDKFIAHFRDASGQAYTCHLTGTELVAHLDAKFRTTDHRLVAVVPE